MMYSISLLLFILSLQADGSWVYKEDILCLYKYKQTYPENNHNTTVGFFNSSYIYYCPLEEVPIDKISYTIQYVEEYKDFLNLAYIQFPPPERECMHGVALLMNPSIQDEEECHKYQFDVYDDSKIHGVERSVCVFKYDNPFVENDWKDVYENEIGVYFRYIFSGCYAVRFHINAKQKYVASSPIFFNTTYQRKETTVPQLVCRYKSRPNLEKKQMTNFTLDISMAADVGHLLQVALVSGQNKDNNCLYQGGPLLYVWEIDLKVDSVTKELSDQHCDVKFVERIKGYEKRIWCNFEIEAQATNSCFLFQWFDERCRENTIWKPPSLNNVSPCMWLKHCSQTFEHWQQVPIHKPLGTLIQSDTSLSTSSYLLLPIIAIVLIVSAVIGLLCFRRYLRIRKDEINLYVNPQHDDSSFLKSTDSGITDNSKKEICHDNPSCDNIILLYTNSSTSFMALMKDFRKTLAKMCSCSVHDWHDGTVWNEVAKVGAVSWFTDLLNNECRVIWIDTLATRSTIISTTRDDVSNTDKISKYHGIHDFRDLAFRCVLEVAKSKVNDVARQYRKHFVVRFEGLESTTNVADPFLDLSPHARYYMPQHLVQLCSDLSMVKPEIFKCKTKIDKDVYRIFNFINLSCKKQPEDRHLKSMKINSTT